MNWSIAPMQKRNESVIIGKAHVVVGVREKEQMRLKSGNNGNYYNLDLSSRKRIINF